MMPTDVERVTIHYRGRVQGVGFRYNACTIGRGLPVAGYVRNLEDGRVLLVAEGLPEDLADLMERIDRRMSGFVREKLVAHGPATGEFGPAVLDSFVIRQ